MKTHSTNYTNTFIAVADDCPAVQGEIPAYKGDDKSIAFLQYEMIAHNPYRYTSDEIIFGCLAAKKDLSGAELEQERKLFFSKGQACLRASALTKRYGWGAHHDAEGKVAIFALDSPEYQALQAQAELKQVKAMRSKKA